MEPRFKTGDMVACRTDIAKEMLDILGLNREELYRVTHAGAGYVMLEEKPGMTFEPDLFKHKLAN